LDTEKDNHFLISTIGLTSQKPGESKLFIDKNNCVDMISCTDEKGNSIYQSTKSFIPLITKFKVLKKDIDFVLLPKASNMSLHLL
jgi:hypothetical protein